MPHPIAEHAKEKFKDSVPTGADMSSVRSLRVVLLDAPVSLERTVRWARQADNTEPGQTRCLTASG